MTIRLRCTKGCGEVFAATMPEKHNLQVCITTMSGEKMDHLNVSYVENGTVHQYQLLYCPRCGKASVVIKDVPQEHWIKRVATWIRRCWYG